MDIGKIERIGDRVMPGYTPPAPGQPMPAQPQPAEPQKAPATPTKTPEKVPA